MTSPEKPHGGKKKDKPTHSYSKTKFLDRRKGNVLGRQNIFNYLEKNVSSSSGFSNGSFEGLIWGSGKWKKSDPLFWREIMDDETCPSFSSLPLTITTTSSLFSKLSMQFRLETNLSSHIDFTNNCCQFWSLVQKNPTRSEQLWSYF